MARNLPLTFAMVCAGAILLDKGGASLSEAFSSHGSSSSSPSSSTTGSGGPIKSAKGLTVKGAPAAAANVRAANVILGEAAKLGVSAKAATAMVYAAIYESGLLEGGARNSSGYGGVLAGGTHFSTSDSVGMARAFLLGDSAAGYQAGGAQHLTDKGASIPEAAVRTEVPSIWPNNSYASESGYGSDQRAIAEAAAWVKAYGGFR